jgi:hypothetical protein
MTAFSVVYYSHNQLPEPLSRFCLRTLAATVAEGGGELICVTWRPLDEPTARNIVWKHHVPSLRNIYEQILTGLAASSNSRVALAEHDVLYPPGYHRALLSDSAGLCYNTNVWRLNTDGFFQQGKRLLSNCGGSQKVVSHCIREKLDELNAKGRVGWAEPEGGDEISTPLPTVDIRHGRNSTGPRTAPEGFYHSAIPHWGEASSYIALFSGGRESAAAALA